jgi:hypothetical protein
MTINELIERLEEYRSSGRGDLEALIQVNAEQYPIVFVEDTGDGDFLTISNS